MTITRARRAGVSQEPTGLWVPGVGLPLGALVTSAVEPEADPVSYDVAPVDDFAVYRDAPTVAHNYTDMPVRSASAVNSQDRDAYYVFDLTGVASVESVVTFAYTLNHPSGLNVNHTLSVHLADATIEESAATWNNVAVSAAVASTVVTQAPQAGVQRKTYQLAQAWADANLPGRFVVFRFRSNGGTVNTTSVNVLSKEHGNAAHHPDLTFTGRPVA